MPILLPLILSGGGFIILNKILSALLKKDDILYSIIDGFFNRITGKSILLATLVPFGAMIGSFKLGYLLYPTEPIIGWVFVIISFILFAYIASHRFRI